MDQQTGSTEDAAARQHRSHPVNTDEELEFDRGAKPDGQVNLVLRFATESGPRTIIAAGVPRKVASDIVGEMEKAGHCAEYTDYLGHLSLEYIVGGFPKTHR